MESSILLSSSNRSDPPACQLPHLRRGGIGRDILSKFLDRHTVLRHCANDRINAMPSASSLMDRSQLLQPRRPASAADMQLLLVTKNGKPVKGAVTMDHPVVYIDGCDLPRRGNGPRLPVRFGYLGSWNGGRRAIGCTDYPQPL
jgi:hypothetical protein